MNRVFGRGLDLGSRKSGPDVVHAKHWVKFADDEEALPFADTSFDLVEACSPCMPSTIFPAHWCKSGAH